MIRAKRPASFRRELTVTFAIGVICAALATTGVSVVLTQLLVTHQFRAQALAEAALAARESLPPLSGAPSYEARHVLENMLGWPNVTYVVLHDASTGHPIAEAGSRPDTLAAAHAGAAGESEEPHIAKETADYCQVVVPLPAAVSATSSFGDFFRSGPTQHPGDLQMVFAKSALDRLTLRVAASSSCAGAVIAVLILLWVTTRIRTMTVPLASLAAVMERQDKDTPSNDRASTSGVIEVRQIAQAFNRLMARINEYTNSLERLVEERTREWRRASEAAQQAERCKSALLQASTHEMKMPLHLIVLHVRAVLHELEFVGPAAGQARKSLALIVQAAQELLSRIGKILDAARAAGARHEIVETAFSIPEFIDCLRERAEALASSQSDELTVEWTGAEVACADREKLFEIAGELLLNACKFTRGGSVRLLLAVSDRALAIEVTDNGRGIPEAEQGAIWLEFQQGSGDGNPTYPGQGLGLSMVRQLVEALRGSVSLKSAPGEGTRVQVTIPLSPPADPDAH